MLRSSSDTEVDYDEGDGTATGAEFKEEQASDEEERVISASWRGLNQSGGGQAQDRGGSRVGPCKVDTSTEGVQRLRRVQVETSLHVPALVQRGGGHPGRAECQTGTAGGHQGGDDGSGQRKGWHGPRQRPAIW